MPGVVRQMRRQHNGFACVAGRSLVPGTTPNIDTTRLTTFVSVALSSSQRSSYPGMVFGCELVDYGMRLLLMGCRAGGEVVHP